MKRKKNNQAFDAARFLTTSGDGRTVSRYPKHQKLFSQGGASDAVYFIQKGRVKITVVSDHGKEAVVAILDEGELCGEGCLIGSGRRLSTARAMTDCEITRIEKVSLLRTLTDEPVFSAFILERVLTRTVRVEADLVDQMFNSSEKRLARALLILAKFGKESEPEPVVAKISQETLAEMVGTTRSRVNFFMNKFRKLGFITYDGPMKIHSSLLSVVLSDIPPKAELERSGEDQ